MHALLTSLKSHIFPSYFCKLALLPKGKSPPCSLCMHYLPQMQGQVSLLFNRLPALWGSSFSLLTHAAGISLPNVAGANPPPLQLQAWITGFKSLHSLLSFVHTGPCSAARSTSILHTWTVPTTHPNSVTSLRHPPSSRKCGSEGSTWGAGKRTHWIVPVRSGGCCATSQSLLWSVVHFPALEGHCYTFVQTRLPWHAAAAS